MGATAGIPAYTVRGYDLSLVAMPDGAKGEPAGELTTIPRENPLMLIAILLNTV